jgi:hypothetical protein
LDTSVAFAAAFHGDLLVVSAAQGRHDALGLSGYGGFGAAASVVFVSGHAANVSTIGTVMTDRI